MDSEEERLGETDKQEEKKKDATEVEEKVQVEGIDGEVRGKGEEKEEKEEKHQEDERAEEEKEVKEKEDKEAKGKELAEDVGEEEGDEDKEEEEEDDEKKDVKKESRTERVSETGELSSPRTPGSDRPTRERKMVERFTINATPRGSATKPLAIVKGQGTQLKDIANVTFKLSKRKADENLQLLHSILFGKKAKVHNLKKNIGQFSGFVWIENEGKQRAKVKEKLDKCVKEKLLDFCDVLDIPVNRATVKKEELSVKILEFLESPHATTETLLSDKEKGKRRKSNESASKGPGSSNVAAGKSTKKQKIDSDSGKKRKHSTDEEDDNQSEPSQSEGNHDDDEKVPGAERDLVENDSDQETNVDQDKPKKQTAVKKGSSKTSAKKDDNAISDKSKSVGKSSASKKGTTESESNSKMKESGTKKTKRGKETEKDTSLPAKDTGKSSSKVSKKDKGEGKSSKKAKKEPSYEEMQVLVVDILKEVDFNTATLLDILRQLGKHFGIDLMHRKSEVKNIITEAIKNMSDEDEDEEANTSGDEPGKEGQDDED